MGQIIWSHIAHEPVIILIANIVMVESKANHGVVSFGHFIGH